MVSLRSVLWLPLAALFAWLLWASPAAWAQEFSAAKEHVVLADAPPRVPEGWDRVSATYLEVYGAPDSGAVLMDLSRHGSKSLPRLAAELGVAIGRSVHVVVAPTQESFFALQPGKAPEWADGTAYPSLGQIFLRRPLIRGASRPLPIVLDHELVHILLGRAFAPQVPPRWLQEGVAQVYAGEYGPETTQEIARNTSGRGLYTLEELTVGFPSDPRRAGLAYAQSADFVAWLRDAYGDDALRTVIADMRAGADVRGALRRGTGEFFEDLDAAWRARLPRPSSGYWALLQSGELFWGLTGAFAMVGLVLARRRIRHRVVRLREQERLRDALLRALWRGRGPLG